MAAASSKGNVSAGTLIALIAALGAASPAITSGEKQAPDGWAAAEPGGFEGKNSPARAKDWILSVLDADSREIPSDIEWSLRSADPIPN